MDKPIITWYVENESDDNLEDGNGYYIGSFMTEENIVINILVWNNKYGNEDVEDIENAKITLSFDSYEDSVLLNLCKICVDGSSYEDIEINESGTGTFDLGFISGQANTGSTSDINNYKNILIKFSDLPSNLQEGLKSLFVNISYD